MPQMFVLIVRFTRFPDLFHHAVHADFKCLVMSEKLIEYVLDVGTAPNVEDQMAAVKFLKVLNSVAFFGGEFHAGEISVNTTPVCQVLHVRIYREFVHTLCKNAIMLCVNMY